MSGVEGFQYLNRYSDLTNDTWKAGDPWDQHYPAAGFEDRDQQLEDYLSRIVGSTLSRYGANLGRRNLVDNGEMMVTQRYAVSTAYTAPAGAYYTDRWAFTPPPGVVTAAIYPSYTVPIDEFGSIQIIDVGGTPKPALGAGDFSIIGQPIEGQHLQHLRFGTAAAVPLTLSFWAQVSVAGVYIVELYADTSGACVSRAVSLTTTWTKYSVTFPGDTVNAIPNTNGVGLRLQFWLAAGTAYSGGATLKSAWNTTSNTRAVGQTNLFAVASQQFKITGVQLEVGTVATPYEHRRYADELQACLRCFERIHSLDNPASILAMGYVNNPGTTQRFVVNFKVVKRAPAPLVAASAAATFLVQNSSIVNNVCTVAPAELGSSSRFFTYIGTSTAVSAGASAAATLQSNATTAAFLDCSAEL